MSRKAMPTNEMGRRRREHPSPQSKGGDASMTEIEKAREAARLILAVDYGMVDEDDARFVASALLSLAPPLPSSAGWQPISTAPKGVVARAPQSVIDVAIKNLDYWSQHKHGSDELQRDLKYAAGVLRNLSAQPPPSQEGASEGEGDTALSLRSLRPFGPSPV